MQPPFFQISKPQLRVFLLGLALVGLFNFLQLTFLLPSLGLYYFLSQGEKGGRLFYLSEAIITLFFCYFSDIYVAPLTAAFFTIFLAELTRFTKEAEKLIKITFITSVVLYFVSYFIIFATKHTTIESLVFDYYQKNLFPYFNEIYKNNPEILRETEHFFKSVIPYLSGIINAGVLFFIWLNVYLVHKKFPEIMSSADLSRWCLPDNLIWLPVFALALISTTLLIDFELLCRIGIDILITVSVLFFLQGISVISFFLKKINALRGFHGLIYFLIILYLNIFIFILGFLDFWIDFKKLKKALI